jgi:hypothetical protein
VIGSAARHGIARIDEQIEQGEFQLIAIDQEGARSAGMLF